MTRTHTGQAFGLAFSCPRPLPELAGIAAGEAGHLPRVEIEWGDAAALRPPWPGGLFQASPDHFELHIPDIATYAVTADRIRVTPAPGVDDNSVRAFLFGSAIGALLHLRGIAVLHGSAVRLPDGSAAVFCGHSTAGKSTLAAALAGRGHVLLADDVTAVTLAADGRAWCLPGLARTKLWRHALQSLGLQGQAGPGNQVRPELDKYSLQFAVADAAAPLQRLYELQALEQGGLRFTPITGLAKLNLLQAHTFRPTFLAAMGRQAQQLRQIAALAPQLSVTRIERPRHEPTLDAICEWLERQWAS